MLFHRSLPSFTWLQQALHEGSYTHPKIINKPNQWRQVQDPASAEKDGAAWYGAGGGGVLLRTDSLEFSSKLCRSFQCSPRRTPRFESQELGTCLLEPSWESVLSLHRQSAWRIRNAKVLGGRARGSDTPQMRILLSKRSKGNLAILPHRIIYTTDMAFLQHPTHS